MRIQLGMISTLDQGVAAYYELADRRVVVHRADCSCPRIKASERAPRVGAIQSEEGAPRGVIEDSTGRSTGTPLRRLVEPSPDLFDDGGPLRDERLTRLACKGAQLGHNLGLRMRGHRVPQGCCVTQTDDPLPLLRRSGRWSRRRGQARGSGGWGRSVMVHL